MNLRHYYQFTCIILVLLTVTACTLPAQSREPWWHATLERADDFVNVDELDNWAQTITFNVNTGIVNGDELTLSSIFYVSSGHEYFAVNPIDVYSRDDTGFRRQSMKILSEEEIDIIEVFKMRDEAIRSVKMTPEEVVAKAISATPDEEELSQPTIWLNLVANDNVTNNHNKTVVWFVNMQTSEKGARIVIDPFSGELIQSEIWNAP
jgi:hypothetical protein